MSKNILLTKFDQKKKKKKKKKQFISFFKANYFVCYFFCDLSMHFFVD